MAPNQNKNLTEVSTHSRLKAAGNFFSTVFNQGDVSTHSRLKAAGSDGIWSLTVSFSFNTQPPEGGWDWNGSRISLCLMFQHTAA